MLQEQTKADFLQLLSLKSSLTNLRFPRIGFDFGREALSAFQGPTRRLRSLRLRLGALTAEAPGQLDVLERQRGEGGMAAWKEVEG